MTDKKVDIDKNSEEEKEDIQAEQAKNAEVKIRPNASETADKLDEKTTSESEDAPDVKTATESVEAEKDEVATQKEEGENNEEATSASESDILKLKDVAYRYKGTSADGYVLRDVNYSFVPGKSYVIKGPSGSGKTTLLSLISGLEPQYEGSITFKGKQLSEINLDKYRSRDIGIVFQSYNLLPHLTAAENIILSMDISHVDVDDKKELAVKLMERVGLKESLADRRVLKLSGGEQQRVAIARSLSYDPDMIIADEPTGNLDKDTETDIMEIFTGLASQGKTVIIVSHSDNVCEYADEVYTLKKRS